MIMSEWISVEDRLPNKWDEFLVWPIPNHDMNIITAIFHPWDKKWNQDCYNGHSYDDFEPHVTHWMPLPEPPAIEPTQG